MPRSHTLRRVDRYFCEDLPPSGDVVLEGDEAHHLARVKRARAGDRVLLFDGRGREAAAEVAAVEKRGGVRLALLPGEAPPVRELATRVTIGVAPPRGKRMSVLLEKATELGAAGIFALETARGVVDARAREEHRREKWQRATIEAAKQCGVRRLPEIGPARGLADALALPADLRIILHTDPGARALRDIVRASS